MRWMLVLLILPAHAWARCAPLASLCVEGKLTAEVKDCRSIMAIQSRRSLDSGRKSYRAPELKAGQTVEVLLRDALCNMKPGQEFAGILGATCDDTGEGLPNFEVAPVRTEPYEVAPGKATCGEIPWWAFEEAFKGGEFRDCVKSYRTDDGLAEPIEFRLDFKDGQLTSVKSLETRRELTGIAECLAKKIPALKLDSINNYAGIGKLKTCKFHVVVHPLIRCE